MMRNGSYSAWFRTKLGEGVGVVALSDGVLTGGDSVSSYTGAYALDGAKFTASIVSRRCTEGPSVFGIDNVDLTLIRRLRLIGDVRTCLKKQREDKPVGVQVRHPRKGAEIEWHRSSKVRELVLLRLIVCSEVETKLVTES